MRKSLHDIEKLEAFIRGRLNPEEAQEVRTDLLLHPSKYQNWMAQRETYTLVQAAGRKQLKRELQAIHQSLQKDPSMRRWWLKIQTFFSR